MVKTIHYIWLGGKPKGNLIKRCIDSWKKYMMDWDIVEWNESNLNLDINCYCREAYDAGRFAFASDVLRFFIISQYGGLYLDVDVEIKKSFDDLLTPYECVSGFEFSGITVNPGLILYAANANNAFITNMLNSYDNRTFNAGCQIPKTICQYTTEVLTASGLRLDDSLQTIGGVTVFPSTYFCPTNKEWSVQKFSKETRCIHHYNASWIASNRNLKVGLKKTMFRIIGPKGILILKKLIKGN